MEDNNVKFEDLLEEEQEALLEMLLKEKIKEDAFLIALGKLGGTLTITRNEFEKIKHYHLHIESSSENEIKLTLELGQDCKDNTTKH